MSKKHQKQIVRVAVLPILMNKCKVRKKRRKKTKLYLVTTRAQGRWIIPTGKREKHLSNRQVAVLEAFEEAGIIGTLDDQFEMQVRLHNPSSGKKRMTIVFLLYVERILDHWPEDGERMRKAVNVQHYARTVSDKKLKQKLLAI